MIWVLVALLVAWGNAGSSLLAPTAILPGGSWAFAGTGVILSVLALAVSRLAGLDREALGLGGAGLWRGAVIGALAGSGISVVGVLALQIAPLITGAPVVYDPLREIAGPALGVHLLVFLPLGTVLPEELAFRGALVGALARSGVRVALLGSAGAFALWHGAVAVATVDATTIARTVWALPAIAVALAVVFAGGFVLAWLRLVTRTLASTIAAHWAFNGTLLVGLWLGLPHPGNA